MSAQTIFFIVFFLGSVKSYSQNFTRAYIGNRPSFAGGSINSPSSCLISDSAIVFVSRNSSTPNNLILRRTNRLGQIIDSAYYFFPAITGFIHTRPYGLQRLSESKMALIIDIIDTSNYSKLFILNHALDTLKSVTIKSDTIWRVYSYDFLVEDSTITVICQLNRHTILDQQLLIAQFDTALNPLWQTTIEDWRGQNGGYYPARIMRLHDAYYIVGKCEYPNWVEGFLDKIDLTGNLIWDKRYRIGNSNAAAVDVLNLADTIVLMINNNSSTSYDINMWLLKIDTSGQTLMDTVYPTLEFFNSKNIIQTSDGNLVMVGYYDNSFTYRANGLIYKLDRNFNLLWQRSYVHQSSYDENRLWRIHEWPDGSLLATGSLEWWYNRPPGVPHDHVWLLSLDSNGCLAPGNCGVLSAPEEEFWPQQTGALQLFPNPATTTVTLNLPGLNGQATVSLSNIQGQKMHEQSLEFTQGEATLTLPLGLPVGTYLITLKTKTDVYTTKLVVIQ